MSDKVRRIARAAKRKVNNDIEFPAQMIALIEEEAASVYQVLGSTAAALVNNDLAAVLSLSEEDEAVHGVYQEFFRVFNRTETMEVADDATMDDFRRTVMVSRYLDRIASISMECAYRLVFLLTGQRWSADDIAEADEEELESMRIPSGEGVTLDPASDARYVLESMRIPSGEGVTLDPASDARYVSHLAPDEVGAELAALIADID